jgi:hypothetical protein
MLGVSPVKCRHCLSTLCNRFESDLKKTDPIFDDVILLKYPELNVAALLRESRACRKTFDLESTLAGNLHLIRRGCFECRLGYAQSEI